MGVPLDDTWIHFQFADNFSKGYFFQFNPGEPTAGTTSPLYVIILAMTSFVIRNYIVNSIFLSVSFHILSCIFIYKISLVIFNGEYSPLTKLENVQITPRGASLVTTLLTIFAGRFMWSALSGMETTMFTFFCLAAVYYHIVNFQRDRFTLLPALLFSLATVSRPEGFLLFGLYLIDAIANLYYTKTLKLNIWKLVLSVLIFAAISFPYLIFSYDISGHFFPNTFRGQGGGFTFIPDLNYLRIVFVYFFRDNFITGILYLISIIIYITCIKKYFGEYKFINLILLWIIFLPLVSSVLIPNHRHHVRYLIPLIPFINFTAVYFFLIIMSKQYVKVFKNVLKKRNIVFVLLISVSFIYFIVYAVALGKNTDNINSQQVKLALWVKENVGRDETIALNDIGAITFIK